MGRNLFPEHSKVGQQNQTAAEPTTLSEPSKSNGRNLLADKDYESRVAGMTHEQIVDEYRRAKIGSPYYQFLVQKIEQPLPGETPEQAKVRAEGQQPSGAPSKALSAFGGATDTLTFGGADELGAGIDWLRGEDFDTALKKNRQFRDDMQETNPGSYLAGQIGGGAIQAVATLGASVPETFGARLGMNMLGAAAQGGGYGALSSDGGIGDRLGSAAEGAVWGAGFGALPSMAEGIYKTGRGVVRAGSQAVRPLLNPRSVAEERLAGSLAQDYIDHGQLVQRELAAGAEPPDPSFLTVPQASELRAQGHRVQASDFGGDNLRRELKDASNISPSAATILRGAADARQDGQVGRMVNEINDIYGGEINPTQIIDSLEEEGRRWNKRNYGAAFSHPNAGHMWGPAFQNVVTSPEGQAALREAVGVMKTDAMTNGHAFFEPVFEENAGGRMDFMGFRAPNGALLQGNQGLNLNFWNEFKIALDEQIRGLRKGGFNRKASQLTGLKNDMLRSIDTQLGSDVYARARGDAKEIFDLVGKNGKGGALQAGGEYFKNMNAFSTSEARAALGAMNPMERELFARGYAAELTNKLTQMGDTEDVAKLFRSTQQRTKIYDALGAENAARIEALTHAEQVQGLLRKVIAGGSDTAKNILSAENLIHIASNAAPAAGGAAAGYMGTGDYSGLLLGLATGAGYRYVKMQAAKRVARMMAEIATSEDPQVINQLIRRAARDPEYMRFSQSVSNAVSGAASAAGQAAGGGAGAGLRPRFANGGVVRMAGGDLVADAVKALSRVGRSTVKHPVRKAFPGIYKEPSALLSDVQVAPEDPALKQIFGVTRDDLFEMSKRKGTVKDPLGIESKPVRPSDATENIKTPRNERRLINSLEAARSNEGLWKGMHGWYVMDPAYKYLVSQYGPEEGARLFTKFNTLTGMSSPGSEVVTELQRGSAANMMDNLGKFDQFLSQGGVGKELRGQGFPPELAAVDGHPYHSTSQAPAMDKYLRTGRVEMGSAKVPTYIASSMPEELGAFTDLPVADAHFTRAVGLPDTRTAEKVYDHSMTMGEYKSVAPWFRDDVAHAADLEAVPAQAILWGLYGPQTGVTTAVGAPKLELLAKGIMETARRLGVSPDVARDLVLTGKAHAYEQGGLVSALGAAQASTPAGSSGSGV